MYLTCSFFPGHFACSPSSVPNPFRRPRAQVNNVSGEGTAHGPRGDGHIGLASTRSIL